MSLASGTRLGPYEVQSAIGAGGMGEVYRARDTRLDRTVAIKVLPTHLNTDPDLRARFDREARAISSLQHAHICSLYDVGHEGGIDYLVMEFLEGETLAQRLTKGALPTAEVLRIAIELADALDRAHRAGIVHRDLKPGNIMLTKSGAKLLDFGLAKPSASGAVGGAGAAPMFSAAVTRSTPASPITAAGSIVGTFQYMSPEQVEGREADARSDIFSFGAVLFEMATGKRAFEGKSQLSIASAILEKDPEPITNVQPLAPLALDSVVRNALVKDPEQRIQNAFDLKLQLQVVRDSLSQVSKALELPLLTKRHKGERMFFAGALLAMAVALAWFAVHWAESRNMAQPVETFQILPPENTFFVMTGDHAGPPTLSPDGRKIVIGSMEQNKDSVLVVRSLDSLTVTPLAGTENASYPFWSADSKQIGFFADGKLKRINISGGNPVTVCPAMSGRGGSWNKDDVILFAPRPGSSILKISALGGTPEEVTKFDPQTGENTHRWPVFLPDGKHFLFSAINQSSGDDESSGIYVATLGESGRTLLAHARSSLAYSKGHVLYEQSGMLLALPISASGTKLGESLQVASNLETDPQFNRATFSANALGQLVFASGSSSLPQLFWYDRSGKATNAGFEPGSYYSVRIAPDGKRAAVSVDSITGTLDTWILDFARGVRTRLTFNTLPKVDAIWMPDGKHLLIDMRDSVKQQSSVVMKAADGSGQDKVILTGGLDVSLGKTTRDGRFFVWSGSGNDHRYGAKLVPLDLPIDKDSFAKIPALSPAGDAQPSPDGKWLVYSTAENGRTEIFAARYPSGEGKVQISTKGGQFPLWSVDGKEIFFYDGARLNAAEIQVNNEALEVRAVKALIDVHPRFTTTQYGYDVTPDGKRFLVITQPAENKSKLIYTNDWLAGVKR